MSCPTFMIISRYFLLMILLEEQKGEQSTADRSTGGHLYRAVRYGDALCNSKLFYGLIYSCGE